MLRLIPARAKLVTMTGCCHGTRCRQGPATLVAATLSTIAAASATTSASSTTTTTPIAAATTSSNLQQQQHRVLVAAFQHSQRAAQGGLAASSSSSSPQSSSSSTSTTSNPSAAVMFAADDANLRQSYKEAVERRVVGNASLRKLIKGLHTSQFQHAVEAIEGAKLGGLVVDSDTCEAYLAMLLDAGQLRQAMEVYHYMLQHRVCPNTKSYNQLMDLCLAKQSWESALTLFGDMQRRGRQPDVESYERALVALSLQSPPNWERAVQVFDKLQRNKAALSSHTYNALMEVYLKMEPFDWRVVYNAYLEMRAQRPAIQFGWNSYRLVAKAMKQGNAGKIRRMTTYADAWIQITRPFSLDMLVGLGGFLLVIFGVRISIMLGIKYLRDLMMENQSESETPIEI